MTTTTITAPRRSFAPWMLALIAVLIGLLVLSGARLTWDVPTITVDAEQVTPAVSAAAVAQAERLAAARQELTALRRIARDVPAIGEGLHDEMQLLAAVSAGHVPVQALEADRSQLEAAVRSGLVPREALDPSQ
jgi:hypothetical protein